MKFIKQIAQRLNPDLHIPGTDSPPSSPALRKAKSSSTLLVTEKRKGISTPPSNSSLRNKTSSVFLARGSNVQDFASWGDSPTTQSSTAVATSAIPATPTPPRTPTQHQNPAVSSSEASTRTRGYSTQTSTRTSTLTAPPQARSSSPTLPIAIAMSSVRTSDKSSPYLPLAGQAKDGYSNAEEATATCYCGAVQLAFPVDGPGMVGSFVCNCTDCRKITASMFASNFVIKDSQLRHLRGQENLSVYSQATTIASGHPMANHFCKTCGTLMYRVGGAFPGVSILRLGTVDDFNLVETKLKPQLEQFIKDRVSWFGGVQGSEVKREQAMGVIGS